MLYLQMSNTMSKRIFSTINKATSGSTIQSKISLHLLSIMKLLYTNQPRFFVYIHGISLALEKKLTVYS